MVSLGSTLLLLSAQAPAPTPVTDQETELGAAVYKELKAKTSIIAGSRSRATNIHSSST